MLIMPQDQSYTIIHVHVLECKKEYSWQSSNSYLGHNNQLNVLCVASDCAVTFTSTFGSPVIVYSYRQDSLIQHLMSMGEDHDQLYLCVLKISSYCPSFPSLEEIEEIKTK